MKFKFKVQQYQTDAVNAVADVFKGQPYLEHSKYTIDMGVQKPGMVYADNAAQLGLFDAPESKSFLHEDYDIGFANNRIELLPEQILENIQNIQTISNIGESTTLSHTLGAVDLDVEMETGTGKTYVYIKTMFELNKRYGFSKFMVVVPSIAIREGVKKSFEMTQEHFMDSYGKKARFFIYNSKKLDEIEQFSSSSAINVMIINIQAFNARGADARRIYEELDEFQSRRPIDVIAKNRPIVILDEPQKMGGEATQESLKRFNPLFSINYSATHKVKHNTVYVLDALDAFNKRLVKKIKVKGFAIKNLRGTNGYMYLQDIILSPNKPPMAKIEFEIKYTGKINRETRNFAVGGNLYQESRDMEQYKGFVISEINPFNNTVTFINGNTIELGQAYGDVNENDIRRIQIRETIRSHFENEEALYAKGIKVLSLFFIDEVAKYRQYDENGDEINGIYGRIFEEEYNKIVSEYITVFDTPYVKYLQSTTASQVHKGYFSIDKKGRKVDSSVARGSDISDDVSAYDLILKDKERLLSFEEPTRFIFSHSALREGWDNPNVFQICTLKHSDSTVQRRQEVGRGLRLCVDSTGNRMDATIPGFDVHSLNVLTVIANDSYEDFVKGLQTEIKDVLYQRPSKASKEFFNGKKVVLPGGIESVITPTQAHAIYRYLIKNDYIDDNDRPTDAYKNAVKEDNLAILPDEIKHMTSVVHKLVQSTYDTDAIKDMVENGNVSKVQNNVLNENFKKKEFQALWNLINHKYAYTVDFDSQELIKNAIQAINKELFVTKLTYTVSTGEQKSNIDAEEIKNGVSFRSAKTRTETLSTAAADSIRYDLLGKIITQTLLTRKTVAEILTNIDPAKFVLYQANPEEFINKVSKIINEQKATLIVDHVTYDQIEGNFDAEIFAESKATMEFKLAYKAEKHIKDYIFVDGINKDTSVERDFAVALDNADEVCVYAKLPRGFYIPTPVGNYSPDWAIAFNEGTVKHIYFVAETKGSLDSLQLRAVERAKIDCARKLFNEISTSKVRYEYVSTYTDLLDKMNALA